MSRSRPSRESLAEKLEGVEWHGRYFSALCPFHGDSDPSLLVFEDGAYCLGCHRKASLEAIWRKVQGFTSRPSPTPKAMDFINWRNLPSPEELADEAHDLLCSFPGQFTTYLQQRGIENCITPQNLGWYDGWYTIPGYNDRQEFQGLILRADPGTQAATGKRYLTPPGQKTFLYVPDRQLVKRYGYVYLTFGVVDALALCALGFPSASPSMGTRVSASLLNEVRLPITIIPDLGEETIARKLISDLGWRGHLKTLNYPESLKDPAGFMTSEDLRRNLILQLES